MTVLVKKSEMKSALKNASIVDKWRVAPWFRTPAEELAQKVEHAEWRWKRLNGKLADAREVVEEFAASLALSRDPSRDMAWSAKVFEAAAQVSVLQTILALRENRPELGIVEFLQEVESFAAAQVAQMARSFESSTSKTANLNDRCLLKVWAEVQARSLFW